MEKIKIRIYLHKDRKEVRKLACDTALMGEPAEAFVHGREVLADCLTRYFTDYEPESCFVAVENGKVIGYLLGAKSREREIAISCMSIFPVAVLKGVAGGFLLRMKNIAFLYRSLMSSLKGEFAAPDFSKTHPAVLHINIKGRYRGRGIGSKLMKEYLNYLSHENIQRVHLKTFSHEAPPFFRKHGFRVLHKKKTGHLRHVLKKDIFHYTLGRKLETGKGR